MNLLNQPYLVSYAQNREDIILSGFFTDLETGFYVDVGANDPVLDSVTKNFYEKGWKGINIEPIKRLYKMLEESRPRDINLNIGISDKKGSLTFREYKEYHGLSTFAKNIYSDYDKKAKTNKKYKDYVEHSVEIKTLKQVFEECNVKNIDFMKVDVEGYELEVLNSNDWKLYRPKVICIESNHISKDWRPLLKSANYSLAFFDGLNDYYVAAEFSKNRQPFSYVTTMLPTPIIDYRVVGILEHYRVARANADAKTIALNNELYALKHQLYVQQEELHELLRFKGLAKAMGIKLNTMIEQKILPNNLRDESVLSSVPAADIKLSASNDPRALFDAIKRYDAANLAALNPQQHAIRYGALRVYRKVGKKGAKKTLKFGYKALRKVKNVGRAS